MADFIRSVDMSKSNMYDWEGLTTQQLQEFVRLVRKGHVKILGDIKPNVMLNFWDLLKQFEDDIRAGVAQILVRSGVPDDADLIDGIDFARKGNMFELLAYDYYQYVSKGRKPHARKVPIKDLIQWIKDKNISYKGSINSAAFAIQQSIYKKGIAGKNFEEAILDFLTATMKDFIELNNQDSITTNLIAEFYRFRNNEFVAIGVDYQDIHKTALQK